MRLIDPQKSREPAAYLKQKYLSNVAPDSTFNIAAFLIFLTIALFIYRASFISSFLFLIDDRVYIILNPFIRDISLYTLSHIFTTTFTGKWAPLHILAYMLLYHFFGLNAPAFHMANMVLFVINGFLLYRIVYAMLGNKYAGILSGLLYLVNPVQVESIMFSSELKTTLSITFIFGSFLSYIHYRKHEKPYSLYVTIFLWFLALMSKAIAFTLPVMFFMYDVLFYPDRVRKRYILYLSLVAIGIAFAASYLSILNDTKFQTPFTQHLQMAIITTAGLFSYPLGQIFPFLVMPYYNTLPALPWLSLPVMASILFLCSIVSILWHYHKTVPFITFWLLWYGINFLPGSGIGNVPMPFMGFIPQGYNHYLPLPFTGLAVLGGFVLARLFYMLRTYAAKGVYILSLGIIITTMSMTSSYGAYWLANNIDLLKALSKSYSSDPVILAALTNEEFRADNTRAAVQYLTRMERRFPDNPLTYYYKGVSLLLEGKREEADNSFAMMQRTIGGYSIADHLDAFLFIEILNNAPYSQRDIYKLRLSTDMTNSPTEFYPYLLCQRTIQGLIADRIQHNSMDIKFAANDYEPSIAYGCAYLQQHGKKENACEAFNEAMLRGRFFITDPDVHDSVLLEKTMRALHCEGPDTIGPGSLSGRGVPATAPGTVPHKGNPDLNMQESLPGPGVKTFISQAFVKVIVLGAVKHTGNLTMDTGARLTDALGMAGGPLPTSELNKIFILRRDRAIKIDFLRYLQTRDIVDNPLLESDDIVYVPKGNERAAVSEIKGRARKYLSKDE
ncbi:MAG: SLBB domain-containing protein [Deltaproteobacteria bacterium]|nr:SLBB domain-containing protein [Deltaproteobacteria bacterium]